MTVSVPDRASSAAPAAPLKRPLLGDAERGGQQHLTPLWALKVIYFVSVGANAGLFRFITVFFHGIGLDTARIGLLQLLSPWVTFGGSFLWAGVCDRTRGFKRVLVVTNVLGVAVVCCLLVPEVQRHFAAICACMVIGPGLLASRSGVTDALTLRVVEEYRALEDPQRRLPSYGEQRLWGAAGYGAFGFLSGVLADRFGNWAMFALFALCLAATVAVIGTQLPSDGDRRADGGEGPDRPSMPRGTMTDGFRRFEVWWFFANFAVYGVHMALVESFLFVYLVRDFTGATSLLLGASVAVMCMCEIPVFLYIDRLIGRFSLQSLLTACQLIFAGRMFAYSLLPSACPWLVLCIEPLHGVTQAAMWNCSVVLGRRLAPAGAEARMQALVGGIYYRAAAGLGSGIWGVLTQPPPAGYGFRPMYELAACTMVLWAVVWRMGWRLHEAASTGASAAAEACVDSGAKGAAA